MVMQGISRKKKSIYAYLLMHFMNSRTIDAIHRLLGVAFYGKNFNLTFGHCPTLNQGEMDDGKMSECCIISLILD